MNRLEARLIFGTGGPRNYGAELSAELDLIEQWTPLLRGNTTEDKRDALEALAWEIPRRRAECRGRPRNTYYVRCWVFAWCRKFSRPMLDVARAELHAGRVPPPVPRLFLSALRTRNRKKQIRELLELLWD